LKETSSGDNLRALSDTPGFYKVENVYPFEAPTTLRFKEFIFLHDAVNITGITELKAIVENNAYNDIFQQSLKKLFTQLKSSMKERNIDYVYDLKVQPCSINSKLLMIVSGNGYTI
jgi:hypothetical protein